MTTAAQPFVSVVLPVCNGAVTIATQLAALAGQTYPGAWEVVVVDNGSTDGTVAIVERWRHRLPSLRVLTALERSGAAYARNHGARMARGALLLFCDADDEVSPQWIDELVTALRGAPIAGGALDTRRLNDPLLLRWRPPLPASRLPVSHGFLPYALTANVGFRADVFARLGGFREDYPVGEDVELAWRAQLHDVDVVFAPRAVVHYRYRSGVRSLLRQYVRYGTIGPRLYRDYGCAGMPGSSLRDVAGPWVKLLVRLPLAALRPARHADVLRRIAYRVGRIRGSLAARVVYL